MSDNTVPFLVGTRQISRDIHNGKHWDIEGITEPDKPRCLIRGVHIQTPPQNSCLVGNNSHRSSAKPAKTDDHIFGIVLMRFQKFTVVHDGSDNILHIICPPWTVWYYFVQIRIDSHRIIASFHYRWSFPVTGRKITQKILNPFD